MTLPAPLIETILLRWPVARLATRGGDGACCIVPIVFAWDGRTLWSPIDGKPKREGELARVRNLRRDPRATLLLDRYDADWSRLWWIRLVGEATIHTADVPEADLRLREPIRLLRAKYPQYCETPLFRGRPTLIGMQVTGRRSWCAGEAVLEDLRQS